MPLRMIERGLSRKVIAGVLGVAGVWLAGRFSLRDGDTPELQRVRWDSTGFGDGMTWIG